MKKFLRLSAALFVFSFAGFVHAGDFVSTVIQAGQPLTITVSGDHFLLIRNFTQECCPLIGRGTVSVMKDGQTASPAFVASIEDPSPFIPVNDPVNEFVVAGPATVTVTCGDTTNCFITYRKGQE